MLLGLKENPGLMANQGLQASLDTLDLPELLDLLVLKVLKAPQALRENMALLGTRVLPVLPDRKDLKAPRDQKEKQARLDLTVVLVNLDRTETRDRLENMVVSAVLDPPDLKVQTAVLDKLGTQELLANQVPLALKVFRAKPVPMVVMEVLVRRGFLVLPDRMGTLAARATMDILVERVLLDLLVLMVGTELPVGQDLTVRQGSLVQMGPLVPLELMVVKALLVKQVLMVGKVLLVLLVKQVLPALRVLQEGQARTVILVVRVFLEELVLQDLRDLTVAVEVLGLKVPVGTPVQGGRQVNLGPMVVLGDRKSVV